VIDYEQVLAQINRGIDPVDALASFVTQARAEAWDEGYSCGLGDYGKDPARETVAANPYREA